MREIKMKKNLKYLLVYCSASLITITTLTTVPSTPFSITASAHQGRTDANGGHKDNKNKSGLGSYHYHCGGNPAHLHTNGLCPYQSAGQPTSSDSVAPANTPVESVPINENLHLHGWQKDQAGWWYLNPDTSYPVSCWKEIDSCWYYFDHHGYMLSETYTPDGCWVDHNGVWVQ